eukprot:gene1803-3500_t
MSSLTLPKCNTENVMRIPRIQILYPSDGVENASTEILQDLLEGKVSLNDLMGPISGIPNQTADMKIAIGEKSAPDTAQHFDFSPSDKHNDELLQRVHPKNYRNPDPIDEYDLVVIGGGVAGLISVIMGAWLGKKCALIEQHNMGGDCLNTGCIPSKAIISCAKAYHNAKHNLKQFGIKIPPQSITLDFAAVMERMREIRSKISHHDSVQRYSREFCEHVFLGQGKFIGRNVVEVQGDDGTSRFLCFKKAIIATGASAVIPSVAGLSGVPHLTNSNLFNLTALPPRLLVIGCGSVGLELAQCFARFGCHVTCFEFGTRIMPREDPDAATLLAQQLKKDGVVIHTGVDVILVDRIGTGGNLYNPPWNRYTVTIQHASGALCTFDGEALLNCTGRAPNVHNLGLDTVHIEWDNRSGVHRDEHCRTAHPDIYACGDCASPFKFTHAAEFQARIAIRNMFLGDQSSVSDLLIPWCTYTDPEVAHVGKYESELSAAGIEFETFTKQLDQVDRCICDGISKGFVKITVIPSTGQILGATVCGGNAGDMISEITLCMQYGLSISDLAGVMHPYPTSQEKYYKRVVGSAALAAATTKYFPLNVFLMDSNCGKQLALKKRKEIEGL